MLRGETRLISIPLIGQIGELLKFAANVYFDFIGVFTAVLPVTFVGDIFCKNGTLPVLRNSIPSPKNCINCLPAIIADRRRIN